MLVTVAAGYLPALVGIELPQPGLRKAVVEQLQQDGTLGVGVSVHQGSGAATGQLGDSWEAAGKQAAPALAKDALQTTCLSWLGPSSHARG